MLLPVIVVADNRLDETVPNEPVVEDNELLEISVTINVPVLKAV
jgi:hypothetical protein